MKIAVIGSGMAGLTAARLLHDSGNDVTVFEASGRRGMDAHTLDLPHPSGQGMVDVPLRVMSEQGWGTVLALCELYGIGTYTIRTPISLSWLDQTTWFRSGNLKVAGYYLPTLGASRYLGLAAATIGHNLWRLWRADHSSMAGKTVEEFFTLGGYHELFWRGMLLPMMQTIATCSYEHLLRYPAQGLVAMIKDMVFGAPLRRMQGGTRHLVDKLAAPLRLIKDTKISALGREGSGVLLQTAHGSRHHFAKVVVATQANQLDFLGAEFEREKSLMRHFVFDKGELVVHRDTRVMPRHRSDWTPLSYLMDRRYQAAMFSVWVNEVEPSLKGAAPVFQTWNPLVELDASQVLYRVALERAVSDRDSEARQHDLRQILHEPERRVYFCGSWAAPGVPLLEAAALSAMQVARLIGSKLPASLLRANPRAWAEGTACLRPASLAPA